MENVGGFEGNVTAGADEVVGSFAGGGGDRARDGEEFAVLIESGLSGDEGAGG